MEQIISFFSDNPLVFMVAVVIAVMIVLSFFRNFLRLAVFSAALVVLYAAWLQASGGNAAGTFDELQKTVVVQFGRLAATLRLFFDFLK